MSTCATSNRHRWSLATPILANGVAYTWGLAEATAFFIVPDVWLTILAVRSLRVSLHAMIWAVLGAACGGALMWYFGAHAPEHARALLDLIPGIGTALLTQVQIQLKSLGLSAMMWGAWQGIPYKVYSVEWGSAGGGLGALLAWTIVARGVRFSASAMIARGVTRLISPAAYPKPRLVWSLIGVFWVVFYVFYFRHVGWGRS